MSDLRDYLNAVCGDTIGQLHVAVGSDPYLSEAGKYRHKRWVQSHFAWPAEADQAERELQFSATDSDVYVCPYLMHADKRTPGATVARPHVHADVDHGHLDPDKVRSLNGFAVASGTEGHGHVYVALAEPVPAHWHTVLCRGLGHYLGGADSKIVANDVLRPPGTFNYKPTVRGGEPVPVQWLVRPTGVRVEPRTLATQLGVTLPDGPAPTPSAGAAVAVELVDLDAYPSVQTALDHATGDRSADTMRVVGACYSSGLTQAQTRYAVSTRADLSARLAERSDDDVLACWLKAIDSRQQRSADWAQNPGRHDDASGATEAEPDDGKPIEGIPRLWRATDLKPAEQPRWLAKGRLPRGAISLVVGDEGIGKSLLWVWIAAALTTGKPLPEFGIPGGDPAHVILVCTEDDWTTTVRPRLEVAGADLAMVRVICTEDDGSGAPIFPRDLFLVAEADPAPTLVVVDAWLDTVPAMLSVRDPQQARQALHPWKELATTTDAAVLLLCHTNRVASANARDRYGATGELRKKARMTLYAQADDEGRLVVGPEKMNTAAPIPASTFTISSIQHFTPTADSDGTVPLLVYAGDSERTAREHIADAYEADHGSDPQDRADAERWLAEYLLENPESRSVDIKRAAKRDVGISERTLQRAAKKLGVVVGYVGMPAVSVWSLANDSGDTDSNPAAVAPTTPVCRGASGATGIPAGRSVASSRAMAQQWRNSGAAAGPAEIPDKDAVAPMTTDTPPGGVTVSTPGQTDRVARALANAREAAPPSLCPVCQRAPARADSDLCDFCTVKADRQQSDREAAS